jgi:transcription antitermination factor NusG
LPAIVTVTKKDQPENIYPFAKPSVVSANWFAVYVTSRHEKRVALHFAQRQIEHFLPLYSARRRWKNGCTMNLALPLFSNYVFVRIEAAKRTRVLEVPGVLSLVGFGRTLTPLSDLEIAGLRSLVEQGKAEPHPYLVVGERVRIVAGSMAGSEGVLIRKKNNFRMVFALDAIMQCVAVEVDAADLEPVRIRTIRVGATPAPPGSGCPQAHGCRPS